MKVTINKNKITIVDNQNNVIEIDDKITVTNKNNTVEIDSENVVILDKPTPQPQLDMPTYKMVLVGDGGVGKSAYVKRLLEDRFIENYTPTLGVDVDPIVINTSLGPMKFNIWDCAGKKEYSKEKESYFKGADFFVVMFDLTNTASFHNVTIHVQQIRNVQPNALIYLIGNKHDMTECTVSWKQMEYLNHTHRLRAFYQCSAKTGYSVKSVFGMFFKDTGRSSITLY